MHMAEIKINERFEAKWHSHSNGPSHEVNIYVKQNGQKEEPKAMIYVKDKQYETDKLSVLT